MTKALTTSSQASTQLERAKRRAVLVRIVEESKKPLTYDEMAQRMRDNPWVSARWPTYSPATASNDFQEILGITRDDIQALAMPYFERAITTMDSVMGTLMEFVNDTQLPEDTRIKAANVLRQYADQSLKVFGNYAPKEMHVRKSSFEFTLDDFNKLRQEIQQNDNSVIDGEILQSKEPEIYGEYNDSDDDDST